MKYFESQEGLIVYYIKKSGYTQLFYFEWIIGCHYKRQKKGDILQKTLKKRIFLNKTSVYPCVLLTKCR